MKREKLFGWLAALVLHAAAAAGLMAWTIPPAGGSARRSASIRDEAAGIAVPLSSGTQTSGGGSVSEETPGDSAGGAPALAAVHDGGSGKTAASYGAAVTAEPRVIFWLEWEGGAGRRRVWAALPAIGQGTKPGVRVRVRAIVRPDGTVSRALPAGGTGDSFLSASTEIVRRWQFSSLPSGQAQRDQVCMITFKVVRR
jgi:hypothetical protein